MLKEELCLRVSFFAWRGIEAQRLASAAHRARCPEVESSMRTLREKAGSAVSVRQEDACRRVLATVLGAYLEIFAFGVFCAWRDLRTMVNDNIARAALEVSGALLARREHVARGVVSSLLAARLETMVLGTFAAWCQLLGFTDSSRATAVGNACNADQISELRDELRAEANAAAACVEQGTDKLSQVARLRERSESAVASEFMEAGQVAEIREELESVEAARASIASELARRSLCHKAREAVLFRREVTTRRVLSALLAAQLEARVRGVFFAWCDLRAGNNVEAATISETVTAAADVAIGTPAMGAIEVVTATLQGEASAAAGTTARSDAQEEVQSLRDALLCASAAAESAEEVAMAAQERTVAEAAMRDAAALAAMEAQAVASHVTRRERAGRRVLTSLLANQLELCERGAFVCWLAAHRASRWEAEEVSELRSELRSALALQAAEKGKPVESEAGELSRLKAALRNAADERDEALAVARRAEMTTSSETEMATMEAQAAARLAGEVATSARLFADREKATRLMFTSVLASKIELIVIGTFSAWREAAQHMISVRK